jgi:hypothetical protein
MGRQPTGGASGTTSGLAKIGVTQLTALLTKCKADPVFRRSLISAPDSTLRAEGYRPDAHWVHFFGSMQDSNFEDQINTQILMLQGLGIAEA